MPKPNAQRTQLRLNDHGDVIVIDTFGLLADYDRETIEREARFFFDAVLQTDARIALIQMGPDRNVRSAHA